MSHVWIMSSCISFLLVFSIACNEKIKNDSPAIAAIQSLDASITKTKESGQRLMVELEGQTDQASARTRDLDAVYTTWEKCSALGRADHNLEAVTLCSDAFNADFHRVLTDMARDLKALRESGYNEIRSTGLSLVSSDHYVMQDLTKVWESYGSCQKTALGQTDLAEDARQLQVCEYLVKAEFVRIDVALHNLDVNPLETF